MTSLTVGSRVQIIRDGTVIGFIAPRYRLHMACETAGCLVMME